MSGRTFSFEVNRTSSAPPATLFRLESDGARWSEWGKPLIAQSSWARAGDPDPGGVGAVRKVGLWPVFMREETVEYERDRRHVYKLIAPSTPAKDYRAEAVFTGPVMLVFLRGAIQLLSLRLIKAAERESATG
jgi:polyketide cyclase/dehydrase/lipid transport protein